MRKFIKLACWFFDPFDEKFRDIVNGIALGFFAIAWTLIISITINRISTYDAETIIKTLTLISVSVGVYIAIWKLVLDQKWRQSEVYLEQAKELFEKSFQLLRKNPQTNYPENDRYLWLSSARLLLAALSLGKQITDPSHKDTFREYVDYWRVQFNDLLNPRGSKKPDKYYYYEEGALCGWTRDQRAPLSEKSLTVIYRFMEWPDGVHDRIADEPNFSDQELSRLELLGITGLYEYCCDIRNVR